MNWAGISVNTSFPPTRRPIYVYPIASVTRKNQANAYPQIASAVQTIIGRHRGSKGLVHTVSYDFNNYLVQSVRGTPSINPFTYASSESKQRAIDSFLYQPSLQQSSVLFAPSLDRGIDLPQTDCRFIIICKLPFPNLGTKQVSARLHSKGGQLWYNVRTIRSLVQMTGRGMRSADDFCESYILDASFIDLMRRNKHLLPQWWKDALVMDRGKL